MLYRCLSLGAAVLICCCASEGPTGSEPCIPQCNNRDCGDDGCNSTCGVCPLATVCDELAGACASKGSFMLALDDGARLATTVYLPPSVPPGGVPTLIHRSPYHVGAVVSAADYYAAAFTQRGYAWVEQHCRGTGGSEGKWEPYVHELTDGRHLVAWVAGQPWSNGRVGAVGVSYDGMTALAAAAGSSDVSVVVADGPSDSEVFAVGGGILNSNTLSWMQLVEEGMLFDDSQSSAATNSLAPAALDRELLGYESDTWQAMVHEPTPTANHWVQHGLAGAYPGLCTPTLVIDSGEETVPYVWRGLTERGCSPVVAAHRLIVAPGLHGHLFNDIFAGVESDATAKVLGFVDHYLQGSLSEVVAGANVYYRAQDETDEQLKPTAVFPPGNAVDVSYYLRAAGQLSAVGPIGMEAADSFVVDPEQDDPCVSYDFLRYESPPLPHDITIVGRSSATLWVSGSAADADFFVWAVDDTTHELVIDGRARARYRHGYDSPGPITPAEPLALTITAQMNLVQHLQAGHRIQLFVFGAACGYVENPHTGEPLDAQTSWRSSTHRVYHDQVHPSRLVLHILE